MATTPQLRAVRAVDLSAPRPPGGGPGHHWPPFDRLSSQAICLYARGLVVSVSTGRDGFIGRAEAEELAEECGALVDELVQVGLWAQTDLTYVICAPGPTSETTASKPEPPSPQSVDPDFDLDLDQG